LLGAVQEGVTLVVAVVRVVIDPMSLDKVLAVVLVPNLR